MSTHCPVCGRLLSVMERVLADSSPGYQCPHCWNLIRASAEATNATRCRPQDQARAGKKNHSAKTYKKAA